MNSQTSILDLPTQILRMIFQRIEFETTENLRNFLSACGDYTDPRISNILSQIQIDNEGIFIYFETISSLVKIMGIFCRSYPLIF